jgi:peptide chain release factor 2
LIEVNRELEDSTIWDNPKQAQALGQERVALEKVVETIDQLDNGLKDGRDLLELAEAENDSETVEVVTQDLKELEKQLAQLEFARMFSGELDSVRLVGN